MTLLDDFKTIIGTTTLTDQFLIDNYLRPAIDRASELCLNYKMTEVTLSNGTQSYDLTSSSIASPVVGSSGIESIVIDGDVINYLQYGKDFLIQGLTTLYIVDIDKVSSGDMTLKYNAYYTKPTASPYDETDLPTNLWTAVLNYAQALYKIEQLVGSNSNGGVERKREDNLEIEYGNIDNRKKVLEDAIKRAENMMKTINGKPLFDYIQVI